MKYIGYHKINKTEKQAEGIEAIKSFCEGNKIILFTGAVYTDELSGQKKNGSKYAFLKNEILSPGDALIITAFSSLGKRKADILEEIQYFNTHDIRLMVLEIPTTLMDYDKSDKTMAAFHLETVKNMLTEMYTVYVKDEKEKRKQSQKEGIESMKKKGEWGKYGRPKKMQQEDFNKAYKKVEDGKMKSSELMEELGLTMPTFYRYKKKYENNKEAERRMAYACRVKDETAKLKKENVELNEAQIEKVLAGIKASMAIEGFELTEDNIDSARMILTGKADADELLNAIIDKYKREE